MQPQYASAQRAPAGQFSATRATFTAPATQPQPALGQPSRYVGGTPAYYEYAPQQAPTTQSQPALGQPSRYVGGTPAYSEYAQQQAPTMSPQPATGQPSLYVDGRPTYYEYAQQQAPAAQPWPALGQPSLYVDGPPAYSEYGAYGQPVGYEENKVQYAAAAPWTFGIDEAPIFPYGPPQGDAGAGGGVAQPSLDLEVPQYGGGVKKLSYGVPHFEDAGGAGGVAHSSYGPPQGGAGAGGGVAQKSYGPPQGGAGAGGGVAHSPLQWLQVYAEKVAHTQVGLMAPGARLTEVARDKRHGMLKVEIDSYGPSQPEAQKVPGNAGWISITAAGLAAG